MLLDAANSFEGQQLRGFPSKYIQTLSGRVKKASSEMILSLL
jgi:hypothetical protein